MPAPKIYLPETIENYPMEGVQEPESKAVSRATKTILVQEGIIQGSFPGSRVAREVISRTLDTQRKKILGEFTFNNQGAFKVGTYEAGVSGELAISSGGITAINSANETTFAIDGDTGDATFGGTLTANVVVATGALVVGTNVGLGTAQDSAGVTTIVGNVVTTGYVNALGITADYVTASVALSSPSITGGTIIGTTIKTQASGVRVELTANDAEIAIYDSGNDKVFSLDDDGSIVFFRTTDARDLVYDVPTGKNHIFRINNVNKVSVGTTFNLLGANMECNNYDIVGINKLEFEDSSQYFDGTNSNNIDAYFGDNFVFYRDGSAKAVIDNDIWTDGTYSEGCSAFIGDPFPILETVKPIDTDKKASQEASLVPLDHKKIHPVLKNDFTDKAGKKHNSMSLSGLVKVQTVAILTLLNRIESLEEVVNKS